MKQACRFFNLRVWLPASLFLPLAIGLQSGAHRDSAGAGTPTAAAVEQNNIGVGYMNQYEYKQAAAVFRKALAEAPDFTLARVNLGIALFYAHSLGEANTVFAEVLSRDEGNPHAHYTLGLSLKTQGLSEEAAGHFRRAAQLDPGDAESHYNLGLLYTRMRKYPEAESALRQALALEPMSPSVMYNLGTLLLKTGRTEEGRVMLEKFRPLQQVGNQRSEMTLGTQYGEMGKYALALDYRPASQAASAGRAVDSQAPFRDVSAEAGLESLRQPAMAANVAVADVPWPVFVEKALKPVLLPALGGSLALWDPDVDGDIDALVTRYDARNARWQTLLLRNDGRGRFQESAASAGIVNSGSQISAAIGDYDNDGLPDALLVGLGRNSLFRNLGGGRFEDVTAGSGLGADGLYVSATFVDYDHDGDLDLILCSYGDIAKPPPGGRSGDLPGALGAAPNRIFRNNGDGSFTDLTETLGLGRDVGHGLGVVPTDLDNDRDVDLVVLDGDAPPRISLNERSNGFRDASSQLLAAAAAGPFRSLAVADFNQDGWMDLFLVGRGGSPNALLTNRGGVGMEARTDSPDLLRWAASEDRFGAGALDYDNDGDLDLYLWSGTAGNSGSLWQNAGNARFIRAGRLGTSGGRASASADFDADGRVDILFLDESGTPRLLRNESRNGHQWIGVRLEGLRSNKGGLGARVEIRAGLEYQKFEIQGHNGYLSQDAPVVWCGLQSSAKADTVTVLWPSGILQSEINVPAGRIITVRELNRKGTSCPLLYTWDGKGFRFVTDFLGGSAIGYLQAPGKYSFPDTDEYVRIEGHELVPKDGRYLVQLANQLEEIIMFDQVQLLVVDHPAEVEVYPNERLMPSPPFPEFKLYTAKEPRLPVSAVGHLGEDVLSLISARDRTYPTDFRLLSFKGYAELHELVLDLGPLDGDGKALLLMDAWIDYADSTSNLAASQAGLTLVPPYLQVKDGAGNWRTVVPAMGFPAGLPKTMVVDLSGKFLSEDRHVRIVTSMRVFWDRIRIDTSGDEEVRVTRLDPMSAELGFLGYPEYYSPDGRLPWIYDYNRIRRTELWHTHAGAYTRFGDVRPLVLSRDDMFVITRHGDQISVAFDANAVPAPPMGWRRDFLLYADGYGKDMDLNSLYPEVIGPLPFHAMSAYPYPPGEKYPDGEAHRRYQREYNTRAYPGPPPTSAPA
ncbi:MAG: FG-GAP-like repeat-containing protein, partial [Acidobacteriota bacterium]